MSLDKTTWKKIKTKYIHGISKKGDLHFPSFAELGRVFNTSHTSISNRAKKEGWTKDRTSHKKDMVREKEVAINKQIQSIGTSESFPAVIAQFDLDSLKIAIIGLKICEKMLFEVMEKTKGGTYTLQAVAVALEKFQKVGKNAVGEALPGEEAGKPAVIIINEIKVNNNGSDS
jgi:hypothetical protein